MITITKAQQLRKEGFNIVTNRNFTKVLRYSKDELIQDKGERIFRAMVKVTYTAEQQKDAWNLNLKINNHDNIF